MFPDLWRTLKNKEKILPLLIFLWYNVENCFEVKPVQLDIPVDVEKLLLELSHDRDVSPSCLAISLLLEKLEDMYDYQVGIEGYHRFVASGRKGTSLEEMRRKLGLERV